MFLMTAFTHDARVTKEARTLVEAGNQVVIFALKSKGTKTLEERDGFLIKRIKIYSRYWLPKGGIFFAIKYLEYVFQNVRTLWSERFDVYHAHDLETLPLAYILSTLNKKPFIYDSHELYIERENIKGILKRVWHRIEKILAPRPNKSIIVCDSLGEIYARRYRVPKPEIIKNCQYPNTQVRKDVLRNILSIPKKDKIIIYLGEIASRRGVDVMIDAMNYLEGKDLVLIGQGDYRFFLREKVKTHQKSDKIFVLDPVPWETLADYTASADLGVFLGQNVCLNVYYILPNKLFEFLSAGLPVVVSDFPEMHRVVIENNVGLVVNEHDAIAAAEAINRILDDRSLYNKMSNNAKRVIIEKYNWQIEGQKLLQLYKNLNV